MKHYEVILPLHDEGRVEWRYEFHVVLLIEGKGEFKARLENTHSTGVKDRVNKYCRFYLVVKWNQVIEPDADLVVVIDNDVPLIGS